METAQDYLERCLELLKKEQVSETTMIIMFHEYAKLYMKEKISKPENNKTKTNSFYGC